MQLQLENECGVSENNGTYSWNRASISKLCEILPEYDEKDIFYSLFNLEQAGFIDAVSMNADGGVYAFFVNYITFSGHEYLASIKDNKNWKKTKEIAGKIGTFSLNVVEKIAEGVAVALLKKELGLL